MADGYLNRCKLCKRDYQRQNANRNRTWIAQYLSEKGCELCGHTDFRVLEFDHIDPEDKEANVADLVAKGAALWKLEEEVEKCRILCANCHRVHTYEQLGNTYRGFVHRNSRKYGSEPYQLEFPF